MVNARKMHKISQTHSERLNAPVNGRRNYYGKEKFEMKNRSTTDSGAATDAKREREKKNRSGYYRVVTFSPGL